MSNEGTETFAINPETMRSTLAFNRAVGSLRSLYDKHSRTGSQDSMATSCRSGLVTIDDILRIDAPGKVGHVFGEFMVVKYSQPTVIEFYQKRSGGSKLSGRQLSLGGKLDLDTGQVLLDVVSTTWNNNKADSSAFCLPSGESSIATRYVATQDKGVESLLRTNRRTGKRTFLNALNAGPSKIKELADETNSLAQLINNFVECWDKNE